MTAMAQPGGVAEESETLAQAATFGSNIFDTVLQRCKDLPRLASVQRAPASWADAQAAVQARDEELRRLDQLRKENSKCKTPEPLLQNVPQPGVLIGSVADASAFWMFVEDYFRDVTYEDLLLLVPHCRDLSQDEAFYVPHVGRGKLPAAKPGQPSGRTGQLFSADQSDDGNERRSGRLGGRREMDGLSGPLSLGSAWAESLISAVGSDGRRLTTMLHGCLDSELRDMTQVLSKLGLLTNQPVDPEAVKQQLADLAVKSGQFLEAHLPLPALHQQPTNSDDRAAMQGVLQAVADMVGVACLNTAPVVEPPPLPKKLPDVVNVLPMHGLGGVAISPLLPLTAQALATAAATSVTPQPAVPAVPQPASAAKNGSTAAHPQQSETTPAVPGAPVDTSAGLPEPSTQATGGSVPPQPTSNDMDIDTAQAKQTAGAVPEPAADLSHAQPAQAVSGAIPPATHDVPMTTAGADTQCATAGGQPAEEPAASASEPAAGTGTSTATAAVTAGTSSGPAEPRPQVPFTGQLTEQADFVHPWTQLLLAQPPTMYVLDPSMHSAVEEADVEFAEASLPVGAATTPLPPAGKTPAAGPTGVKRGRPSNKMLAARAAAAAAAAAAQGAVSGGPASSQGAPVPTASQGDSQLTAPGAGCDTATATSAGTKQEPMDDAATGVTAVPPASAALGRGKRGGKPKNALHSAVSFGKSTPTALALRGAQRSMDQPVRPLVAAVNACVAAGGLEEALEAQWASLESNVDLISAAPDDEILAEILALQSELIQQVAINRKRVAGLLQQVVDDLPNQASGTQARRGLEQEIRNYLQRKAEIKRNQKREQLMQKRAARASFDGLELSGMLAANAARGARPRSRLGEGGEGEGTAGSESREMTPELAAGGLEAGGPLQDIYANRGEADEEALCTVCGDGTAYDDNEILFCERCDIAVHQDCYGLPFVPEGEFLCHPCLEHERDLRQQGKDQSDIRPQRWEMAARGLTHKDLGGGSFEVCCALCPVKRGAFKRTVDGKDWVHLVCALWHTETDLVPGPACNAVVGVQNLKPDRWTAPCGLCKQTQGATVKCAHPNCTNSFHPLCGRRVGNYLSVKANQTNTKLIYRPYCHQHTPAMMQKDTPPEATKPLQALVDIRRAETRKDLTGGAGRSKRGSGAAALTELWESDDLLELEAADPMYVARPKAKAGRGSGVLSSGRGGARGGARGAGRMGRPPGNSGQRVKQGKPGSMGQADGTEVYSEDVFGSLGVEAMTGWSLLEEDLAVLTAHREELDVLRNTATQVVKREKQSRGICRDLVKLCVARQQDPVAGMAALQEVHGDAALADIPPNLGSEALDAADAWWAQHKPGDEGPDTVDRLTQALALQSPMGLPLAPGAAPWQQQQPNSNGGYSQQSDGTAGAAAAPTPPPMTVPAVAATGPKKRGSTGTTGVAAGAGAAAQGGTKRKRDAQAAAGPQGQAQAGVTGAGAPLPVDPMTALQELAATNYEFLQQVAPPPPPLKGPPKKKQKGGAATAAAATPPSIPVPPPDLPMSDPSSFLPLGLSLDPASFALDQFPALPPQPPAPAPEGRGRGKKRKQVAPQPPLPPGGFDLQLPQGMPEMTGTMAPPPPPLQLPGGPRLPPLSVAGPPSGFDPQLLAPPPPPAAAKPGRGRGRGRGAQAAAPPTAPGFGLPPLDLMAPSAPPPIAHDSQPAPEPASSAGASTGRSQRSTGQRQRQPSAKAAAAAAAAKPAPPPPAPASSTSSRRRGAAAQQQQAQQEQVTSPQPQIPAPQVPSLDAIAAARVTPSPLTTADEDMLLALFPDDGEDGDGFGKGLVSSSSNANLLMQQMQMDPGDYGGQGYQNYSEMPNFLDELPALGTQPAPQTNTRTRSNRSWAGR